MSSAHRSSLLRRFWKPAAVTGTGGTALAIWFEEFLLFAELILALLFLPVMAGLIFLFNVILFKTRQPRRKNLQKPGDK